jgi:hypothetical protein
MSPRCVPCRRDFKSDEALQQHKRDSSAHKFACTACDRHFKTKEAMAQHYQDAPIHARYFGHPILLAKPPQKRKSTMSAKPVEKWSMYPSLHNDVSDLLYRDNLLFGFYGKDDENGSLDTYNTTIMGRFICSNTACLAVWKSQQIAVTIRRYPDKRYNARVYYQSCKRCWTTSRPQLDCSYAERVAYRLKKWCGVEVERPPFSGRSDGPHRSDLCEGCKQGHCSKMVSVLHLSISDRLAKPVCSR